jgi:DNA polymerase-3 subunit gamma/tau
VAALEPVAVAPIAPPKPAAPESFADLVEAIGTRHAHLSQQLHDYASLVTYAPPQLAIHPRRPIDGHIAKALDEVFPIGWQVALSEQPGEPTLREQELAAAKAARQAILDSPLVAEVVTHFPGSELQENQRSVA